MCLMTTHTNQHALLCACIQHEQVLYGNAYASFGVHAHVYAFVSTVTFSRAIQHAISSA